MPQYNQEHTILFTTVTAWNEHEWASDGRPKEMEQLTEMSLVSVSVSTTKRHQWKSLWTVSRKTFTVHEPGS